MIISENFKSLWIENYGYIQVGTDGTIIGKKGVLKPNNQNTKEIGRASCRERV